jgi:hypothetical protein
MLKAFIITWILMLGCARASGFTVAPTFGLFTVGGQVGWESDERIGVRVGVGYEVLGKGIAVNGMAYQAFGDSVELRLGGGLTWLRNTITGLSVDYVALAGVVTLLIPFQDGWSLLYELVPTLVVYRSNPAPTLFEMPVRLDEILVSQFNFGLAYRF